MGHHACACRCTPDQSGDFVFMLQTISIFKELGRILSFIVSLEWLKPKCYLT